MGCANSKIDDLPAVALCRERLGYLDLALHQRYVFAETHLAYVHSLRSVGVSLHRFFDSASAGAGAGAGGGGGLPQPSSVLNLPPHCKGDDAPASAASVEGPGPVSGSGSGHLSHSNSGSHLHFNSDSDDDHHHYHDEGDSGSDGSLHHDSHPSSPPQQTRIRMYGLPDGFNQYPVAGGGGYVQMNYMKRQVTPSVSYQQKPMSIETIQPSSSSFNYPAQPFYQSNQMPSSYNSASYYDYRGNYGNSYGYMNYGGGFMGGPAGPVHGQTSMGVLEGGWSAMASSSSSKPTPRLPPPPPAPSTSTWDFLNLFESNYPPYTASLDSREVREREGIPDLEDEAYEHEVVKEVHGNQKLVEENSVSDSKNDSKRVEDEGVGRSENEAALNRGKPSVLAENNPVEYEVHMVDKTVVGEEGKSEQQGKGGGKADFRNVFEVVKEIQVQFERASASGSELDKVLEVGKLRYQRKNAAYQVSSKMLNVITPSLPATSKPSDASLEPDEDVRLRSLNLAASLQKLHLWEKKLFEEVKAEEKMRVLHDRKIQKVKRMNERGAEALKIESTRSAIRNLSTKIRIAIQMVDKISVNINKVRDEELWPQLKELMHGLSRMWKRMLECHRSQCEAIDGARFLDALAFPKNPSDTQLEATLQLEYDLINWTCRFTEWVGAQKGFVRALNSWLLKCLLQEPEETADGVAPFSPGRAGAPPVFVICNLWNQSLERIFESSEKEVIDSMRVFAMMVWHFRERDKGEMRQRMTANRDIERKVKNLEREDSRMQKEIQALDKKMLHSSGGSDGLSLSGHVVYQSDTSSKTSLHSGLLRIFEAMDKFTADSVQVYEELLQRSEEVVGDHGKVS